MKGSWALVSDRLYVAYAVWGLCAALFLAGGPALVRTVNTFADRAPVANTQSGESMVEVTVKRTPVGEEQYKHSAAMLSALFPGLDISGSDAGVMVLAEDVNDYADWLAALQTVVITDENTLWEIASMCAGEVCSRGAYEATVIGAFQGLTTQRK